MRPHPAALVPDALAVGVGGMSRGTAPEYCLCDRRPVEIHRDQTSAAGATLARSSTSTVHLVGESNRTECGLRLGSLVVERGVLSAVTCHACGRRSNGRS